MNKFIGSLETRYSNETIGYIMIFIAGILWGTIGIFVKMLSGLGISSSLVGFMRLFMGSSILVPIMLNKGGFAMFKIDKASLIKCIFLGIFSQALFNRFYNMCIVSVGVATASILLYTAPIFVCVLSIIIFKERIGKQKIIALILNLTGCFLMVSGGDMNNLKISLLGVIFGLAAAFLYSLVTIVGKLASGTIHPLTFIFYSFLFGWLTLAITIKPSEFVVVASNYWFWIYAFGYGFIPTVLSYLFYMGGINKNVEISKAPVIASVETVVATLIGILLYKEEIGFINILGMLLLLFSIAMMNMKFNFKSICE